MGQEATLPALPGAAGFGATATGGRGGAVILVENLNNSGPGSLREALAQEGPRTIIFRVGGTIELGSHLLIRNGDVTILGQSAPDPGITLVRAGIHVAADNVIISNLRVRVGDSPDGPSPTDRDGLSLSSGQRILIDHCSFSWAVDENVGISSDVSDVTVQWCIIAEGLSNSIHPEGEHSKGLLVYNGCQNISIHHNIFAHNTERAALFKSGTSGEFINNFVYNWALQATGLTHVSGESFLEPSRVDIVANVYRVGPDTTNPSPLTVTSILSGSRISIQKNEFPGFGLFNLVQILAGFSFVQESLESTLEFYSSSISWLEEQLTNMGFGLLDGDSETSPVLSFLHMFKRKSVQSGTPAYPVEVNAAFALQGRLAAFAGARNQQGELDAIDSRIIEDIYQGGGAIVDAPPAHEMTQILEQGGTFSTVVDLDSDGLPDAWEVLHGLDPLNPGDATETLQGGMSTLEVYYLETYRIPQGGAWKDAYYFQDDWYYSKWFEWFSLRTPWMYHPSHGWLYFLGEDESSLVFFFGESIGWVWTGERTYPWLYSYSRSDWAYYLEAGETPEERLFYLVSEEAWYTPEEFLVPEEEE